MKEHIIFIKGTACPHTESKISSETSHLWEEVKALESAGHKVTVVGNPSKGFALKEVEVAFQENLGTKIIIVHAHGNIKRKNHYMRAAEETTDNPHHGIVWATGFYKAIGKYAGQTPLNVFMFSCGSGNGCEKAVKFLPRGSTLVNFVLEDDLYSYGIEAEGLKLNSNNGDNFSEQLFLSILCKGLGLAKYYPQLSVSAGGTPSRNMWSLWDLARHEVLSSSQSDTSLEEKAAKFLQKHATPERIDAAFRTLCLYIKSWEACFQETEGSPIKLRTHVDERGFLNDVIREQLLGTMCAIAYFENRGSIGAFQTWGQDRYLGPILPKDDIRYRVHHQFLDPIT